MRISKRAILLAGVGYLGTIICNFPLMAQEATESLIQKADAIYLLRENMDQAYESLRLYEAAAIESPSDPEPYWKAARVAWWIGDHLSDRKEKLSFFKKTIDLAKEGIAIDSQSVQAHFWLSGGYGSYGEEKGIMKSLFLLGPIRRELRDVVELDPNYEGGGGYRVLGVIDYKVPGLAGGNKKRALEQLLKAYTIDSENPYTLFYLAEYHHVMRKDEKAREYLTALFSLQLEEDKGPDLRYMQGKGRTLEASLR